MPLPPAELLGNVLKFQRRSRHGSRLDFLREQKFQFVEYAPGNNETPDGPQIPNTRARTCRGHDAG